VRQSRRLTYEEVLAALRTLPQLATAQLSIVDFANAPLPLGTLELARGGLLVPSESDPAAPVVWRGLVRFGASRSTPFWVRFQARVTRPRLVAAVPIRAGAVIGERDVTLVSVSESPFAPETCRDLACAVGKSPRRALAAAEPVRPARLATPPDVVRGQMVEVESCAGQARVRLRARAEATVGAGQYVVLMNEQSGRRFSALVTAPGRARITVSKDSRNEATDSTDARAGAAVGLARHLRPQTAQAEAPVAARPVPR
jgi:flagella basal body P-ring formation protein FlgA